ncbi:hypothetical protein LCGC14_1548670 [marine sediment metagenome]|uniref:Uncharacterized protein n=1 Tax=marine sediment metagenome TaxID=412755 RepID=A0A0F9IR14_9ZZZZ
MNYENARKQLKNLHYLDEERLHKAALKLSKMTDKDVNVQAMFTENEEKKLARNLVKKYLDDYIIESISDKNTLKQLIYFEVIQYRLQKVTNKAHNENKSVPLKYLDSLHKNSNQIISLKETLGITHDKDAKQDSYGSFQDIMKKFAIHRKNNIADRTRLCPYCGEMIHFIMNMDKYDAKKHPFFQGRFLTNKLFIKLYKEKRITKKEFAVGLEVSEDYIDFLLKRVDRQYDSSDN